MRTPMHKRCGACGEIKPLRCFHRIDGNTRYRDRCRDCQAAWAAQRGRATPPPLPAAPKTCAICAQPLATHWHCDGCGVLGHAIRRGTNQLCVACERERKQQRKVIYGQTTGDR